MIHFHTIHDVEDQSWPLFLDVYTASFPIDEQRPTDDIARLLTDEPRFCAMALLDGKERFVGLLTSWNFDAFIYVEHFALAVALRSQGYGSMALQAFIAKVSPCPVVLEVEPPTDTLARRRVGFYERCGLALYDYDYIQPSYTPDRMALPLRLMGTLPAGTDLHEVAEKLHREVYGIK